MGRSIGMIGVLIALVIGGYFYIQQSRATGAATPRATVDLVGVKLDLANMARAERAYFAREGRYASLDELRSSRDLVTGSDHRGPYVYSSDVTSSGFRITASYSGPPTPDAPPAISIDETMEIR